MEGKEINWKEVKAKTYFKCEIKGEEVFGRIQKEDDIFFLCQNEVKGSHPKNRLGYDYGYHIGFGEFKNLKANYIKNLVLSTKRFKGMPKPPKMSIYIDVSDSYSAEIFHDKIVVDYEMLSYKKLIALQALINNRGLAHSQVKPYLTNEKYPIIDWSVVKSGDWFTAIIDECATYGQIQKEDGEVYLCQDVQDGTSPTDSLGFKYAWTIFNGNIESRTCCDVHYLTLMDEKPQIIAPMIKDNGIDNICGYQASISDGFINVGCQSIPYNVLNKIINRMNKLRKKLVK